MCMVTAGHSPRVSNAEGVVDHEEGGHAGVHARDLNHGHGCSDYGLLWAAVARQVCAAQVELGQIGDHLERERRSLPKGCNDWCNLLLLYRLCKFLLSSAVRNGI